MAFTPKTASGTYYIIDLDTGAITSGPSYGSQTAIPGTVLGWTTAARKEGDGNTLGQLIITVYNPASNVPIQNQGLAVIPNGYTDYKGFQPKRYLRTAPGDVVCFRAGTNASVVGYSDFFVAVSPDGDAILQGQFL